ncbi:ABC transporter transmembrane domain-containing protein, partial [Streptomyces sp. MBT62]|uniref:ABC transporter transmembrane domain-containing protein n=1 Tax=Streptomyces sp. MBT62 TaxID=2800410 RepID=UPI001A1AB10E
MPCFSSPRPPPTPSRSPSRAASPTTSSPPATSTPSGARPHSGSASYLSGWTSEHFLLGLRDHVFEHLQRTPPDTLDRYGTGDLVTRLTGDIEVVETLVASAPVELITSAAGALVFAAAAFRTSWQLALITLGAAPLIWLGARVFGTLMRTATRAERDSNGRLASLLEESLANMPLVQAYGRQRAESSKVHREGRTWMRA